MLYSHSAKDMLISQPVSANSHKLLSQDRTYTEWAISVKASTSQLPPTFVARFYFSGDSPSVGSIDVGSWMRLMPSSHQQSSDAMKHAPSREATIQSQISITSELLDQVFAGKLKSLEANEIVPFLKGNLYWKVLSVCNIIPSPFAQLTVTGRWN